MLAGILIDSGLALVLYAIWPRLCYMVNMAYVEAMYAPDELEHLKGLGREFRK